jgi:hypothetical protein
MLFYHNVSHIKVKKYSDKKKLLKKTINYPKFNLSIV